MRHFGGAYSSFSRLLRVKADFTHRVHRRQQLPEAVRRRARLVVGTLRVGEGSRTKIDHDVG